MTRRRGNIFWGVFNDFLKKVWSGFTVVYGYFYYIVNAFITLTLQNENDIILFLIHLKKAFQGTRGCYGKDSPRKCLKKQTHKT